MAFQTLPLLHRRMDVFPCELGFTMALKAYLRNGLNQKGILIRLMGLVALEAHAYADRSVVLLMPELPFFVALKAKSRHVRGKELRNI